MYILKRISQNPEKVVIQEENGGEFPVYKIQLPKEDIGRVIGKGGSTISAINKILNLYLFLKKGKSPRVNLKIEEQMS